MSDRVVFWDFDGTLAYRPGFWGACVLEVIDEEEPAHTGTLQQLRRSLRGGFPWHRHEQPHPELSEPDAWWESVTPLLARAIEGCGIEEARALTLAGAVRARFIDANRGWQVFDDTVPALRATLAAGWRNVILSNHVPELPSLVDRLGLAEFFDLVITSAGCGYEKPHPEAFRHALGACGQPASRWMVGDNPAADVIGAEAVGIPGVLVGSPERSAQMGMTRETIAATAQVARAVERQVPDLLAAARLIATA